jgi:hypothetical protein
MAANWRGHMQGPPPRWLSNAKHQQIAVQLFNFQWLARPAARSLGSRLRLFINQTFFEQ